MITLSNKDNYGPTIQDLNTYLKDKPADCILYSEDGAEFKIHKEVMAQTEFLRKILRSTKDYCCRNIEILCPCSEEDLSGCIEFFYHGKIQWDKDKIVKNLIDVFGFPANLDQSENFEIDNEAESIGEIVTNNLDMQDSSLTNNQTQHPMFSENCDKIINKCGHTRKLFEPNPRSHITRKFTINKC